MTDTALALPRSTSRPLARDLALAARQVVYEQRSFWRNRTRAFFAFVLPLMFLVIFASLNSGQALDTHGGIDADAFVVPGLLAYGVIMATFMNLATELAAARETGVLKRMRGTPLPPAAFLAGKIGSAIVTAAGIIAVTLTVGYFAYGVHVRVSTLAGFLLALVVGTACFSALGIGVNRVIPNADAAPAVANGLILPLTFISGVWSDFGGLPGWLNGIAAVFPIKHLANSLQVAFDPRTTGSGIVPGDLLVLGIWTAVGVVAAIAYLRRETRRG